uniref:DUF834 domain-containing protein n=1 Tax=Oryza meridionalis TaxID=40149 RepID=A0A0E0D7H6_9ORYZ
MNTLICVGQVVEGAGLVVIVAGGVHGDGLEAVDVDADVVVVRILELGAEDGVELDAEDVVGDVAVVGAVEEAQVLARQRGGEVVLPDEEDDAMAAQVGVRGDDPEHERRREGAHRAAAAAVEAQRRRVHRVRLELCRAVGQLEQPARRDGRRPVQREWRTGEAGVDEPVVAPAGAEHAADHEAREHDGEPGKNGRGGGGDK